MDKLLQLEKAAFDGTIVYSFGESSGVSMSDFLASKLFGEMDPENYDRMRSEQRKGNQLKSLDLSKSGLIKRKGYVVTAADWKNVTTEKIRADFVKENIPEVKNYTHPAIFDKVRGTVEFKLRDQSVFLENIQMLQPGFGHDDYAKYQVFLKWVPSYRVTGVDRELLRACDVVIKVFGAASVDYTKSNVEDYQELFHVAVEKYNFIMNVSDDRFFGTRSPKAQISRLRSQYDLFQARAVGPSMFQSEELLQRAERMMKAHGVALDNIESAFQKVSGNGNKIGIKLESYQRYKRFYPLNPRYTHPLMLMNPVELDEYLKTTGDEYRVPLGFKVYNFVGESDAGIMYSFLNGEYKNVVKRKEVKEEEIALATQAFADLGPVARKEVSLKEYAAKWAVLKVAKYKPKPEHKDLDSKGDRNIAVISSCGMVHAGIALAKMYKTAPTLFDHPTSRSLYGFSFAHGSVDTLFGHVRHHLEKKKFYVTNFADNLYTFEKEVNGFTIHSADYKKAETIHSPSFVRMEMRRAAKETNTDLSAEWQLYLGYQYPEMATNGVVLLGDYQCPVPGLSTGSQGTGYLNHSRSADAAFVFQKFLDNKMTYGRALELTNLVCNVEIEHTGTGFVPDDPKHGHIVKADFLGYNFAYYSAFGITTWLIALDEKRLASSMLYHRSIENVKKDIKSDKENKYLDTSKEPSKEDLLDHRIRTSALRLQVGRVHYLIGGHMYPFYDKVLTTYINFAAGDLRTVLRDEEIPEEVTEMFKKFLNDVQLKNIAEDLEDELNVIGVPSVLNVMRIFGKSRHVRLGTLVFTEDQASSYFCLRRCFGLKLAIGSNLEYKFPNVMESGEVEGPFVCEVKELEWFRKGAVLFSSPHGKIVSPVGGQIFKVDLKKKEFRFSPLPIDPKFIKAKGLSNQALVALSRLYFQEVYGLLETNMEVVESDYTKFKEYLTEIKSSELKTDLMGGKAIELKFAKHLREFKKFSKKKPTLRIQLPPPTVAKVVQPEFVEPLVVPGTEEVKRNVFPKNVPPFPDEIVLRIKSLPRLEMTTTLDLPTVEDFKNPKTVFAFRSAVRGAIASKLHAVIPSGVWAQYSEVISNSEEPVVVRLSKGGVKRSYDLKEMEKKVADLVKASQLRGLMTDKEKKAAESKKVINVPALEAERGITTPQLFPLERKTRLKGPIAVSFAKPVVKHERMPGDFREESESKEVEGVGVSVGDFGVNKQRSRAKIQKQKQRSILRASQRASKLENASPFQQETIDED
jgi:hypothetical protein